MSETMTGGCQCGRIRYAVEIESDEAYLCHCRMCQRATGGVSIAFVNVEKAALRWDSEPDWYASSAIARRPFCSTCGTPLGFAYPDSEKIDLTVGSFDAPGRFRPAHHFGAESLHEAWIDTTQLPRYRTDEHQTLVDRWMKTLGRLPD
ncbi:MAG: GFA family protein [Pseudomonadota bacterium]|uniref:GFA family protein n=1 Tax=Rhizorhabdus phycosphaerae TaxID=2711156 RepID=UPI0013EC9CBC|nr:GFA family protein [Rhizorhabdus phycosphaerae]